MTICFFSAQYLPTVGGVERYTWNLARRLAAAGHRAIVATSALPGLPAREESAEGILIFRLPALRLMGGRFPVIWPLGRGFGRLAAGLWAERPDFCLIQTRFYPLSLWAARQARRRGVPSIVVDHSTGHMPMGSPLLNRLAALYEHAACAFLHRQGPAFYGVSEAVCGWLRHFGLAPAGALYNAVDPAEIGRVIEEKAAPGSAPEDAGAPQPPAGRPQNAAAPQNADAPLNPDAPQALPGTPSRSPAGWRQRLGLAPGQKLIVFAGRLIPEKGAGELIEAFRLLPAGTALLAVAGDGPMLPALKSSCPAGVRLLGSLPHEETLRLMAAADLFCLPTRYAEGFPTTLLEAAGCGCAILCTDTAGAAELLPDESYGLRLQSAAPELLAPALQRALAADAWRAGAAQKARARLCERFAWDAVTARLLQIAAAARPAAQPGTQNNDPQEDAG